MAVNWQIMATATVCRLEFEHLCERNKFLDESALVRTCVEHLQARTTYAIYAEVHHDDLPGDQRLDAMGQDPRQSNIGFVLEAKWLKSDGGTRDWPKEITHDIVRLEMLSQNMVTATDRALVIAGHHTTLEAFKRRKIQSGRGSLILFPHILQDHDTTGSLPYNQERRGIRDCDNGLRNFWKRMENQLNIALAVSYQVSLAGHFKATDRSDAIEAYVWNIRRSRNRSTFSTSLW